jgi:hypothetical protein
MAAALLTQTILTEDIKGSFVTDIKEVVEVVEVVEVAIDFKIARTLTSGSLVEYEGHAIEDISRPPLIIRQTTKNGGEGILRNENGTFN